LFETLPVVHLERRRFPEYPDAEPEQALTALARRFERVVLVDVAGVRRNAADLEFLQMSARKRSLWVDAGSRYATDAMDLFVAGAENVTMRWNTLSAPAELEDAASLAQHGALFVGLEFPRGTFLKNPADARGADDVARHAESLGLGVVHIVDSGDAAFARDLPVTRTPRYLQGGSRALAGELQAWGFAGALLSPAELPPEAPT
jgi:hypothetical protein